MPEYSLVDGINNNYVKILIKYTNYWALKMLKKGKHMLNALFSH